MKETLKHELAEKYGISKRTLERYIEKGVDVTDAKAVEAHQAMQHNRKPPVSGCLDKEAVMRDKARKLKADADEKEEKAILARLKRLEQEGLLVSVEDAQDAAMRYAAAVKAGLNRLQGELPTLVEGLTATEIEKVLEGKFTDALRKIADSEI